MKAASAIFVAGILAFCIAHHHVSGGPLQMAKEMSSMAMNGNAGSAYNAEMESYNCEDILNKYRRFLLHAITVFDDVCDVFFQMALLFPDSIYRDQPLNDAGVMFMHTNPLADKRSDIWTFYKMLLTQFDDIEFSNNVRKAIIERCRDKTPPQRDDKRNTVVLGKKQRFHSWGGKRSQLSISREISDGNNLESYNV